MNRNEFPASGRQFLSERKFTLLELLIVIAIIAILTGLLLPALNKARGKALAIQCVSQLSQIGKGFLLYADDHGSYFPLMTYDGNNNRIWYTVMTGQYARDIPYFKIKIIYCPAKKGMSIGNRRYGCNWTNSSYLSTKKIYYPSKLGLIFDWNQSSGNAGSNLYDTVWNNEKPIIFCHDRRMNWVYADGHTGSLTWPALRKNKDYLFKNQK